MDYSPEYIKMCGKAVEIQPHLNNDDGVGGTFIKGNILYHSAHMNQPQDRDGFYHVTDTIDTRICESCGHEEEYIKSSKAIWLPSQDQLQAMMLPDPNKKDAWGEPFDRDGKEDLVFWLFRDFADNIQERKWSRQTGEQLWLYYVMGKKYVKVWDSDKEDWIHA